MDPGPQSQMQSFYGGEQMGGMMGGGGERVRVALRVRPLLQHELVRADENIITVPDVMHALINIRTGAKSFRFNAVLDEKSK